MSTLRVLALGWLVHFKIMSRSGSRSGWSSSAFLVRFRTASHIGNSLEYPVWIANPWIFLPTLVVAPIFQLLFFAYLGRAAGLESDRFYVIGNALQIAALPGLFAMAFTITGERYSQTLAPLLATPANRAALFLGRALLVTANAAFVCVVSFVGGALLLHVRVPASSLPPLAVVILATSLSCTGFGLLGGAIGLRVRDAIVLINLMDAALLVFCGVNIPLDTLPGWMRATADALPVTHGLQAARRVADGAALADVAGLVLVELAVGAAYAAVGYALLRYLENASRRTATLETS
jgi:ABC-2 type transport system permease protein